jgi:beta-barrel assembly-enhancing protease
MTVRKLQFSGSLFDGKSATKHHVDVELTPQEIILKLTGREPIRWPYSHLRWTAKTIPFYVEHRADDENIEPLETLVVEDRDFYESFSRIAPESFSVAEKESSFSWKLYTAGILILIFFAYGLIKVAPTFLADKMVAKIPIDWEVTIGQSILSMLPVEEHPNEEVIAILQDIVDLLKQSLVGNPPPYDLKVFILPVRQSNALALPGGPIVIFEGLLHEAESPEELAGVLAHEIQHILLRHSTRGVLRYLSKDMLVTLFLGDVNSVMEGIVELTGELDTLGLSREMEAEADKKGMELILSANINPHGMIRIFEKLTRDHLLPEVLTKEKATTENKDMEISSFFSSHPSGRNRLAHLKRQMKPHENRIWTPLFPNLNWDSIKP